MEEQPKPSSVAETATAMEVDEEKGIEDDPSIKATTEGEASMKKGAEGAEGAIEKTETAAAAAGAANTKEAVPSSLAPERDANKADGGDPLPSLQETASVMEVEQKEEKEEEKEGDEKKEVDLGFVPAAGRLSQTPRPNTSFLQRPSWLEMCQGLLENNPRVTGSAQDLRRILNRVLTVCNEVAVKDEELLPVKLCMKYFQESHCLSILLSEVLAPLMLSMNLSTLRQLELQDSSACLGIMEGFSEKLRENAVRKKKKIFISSKLDQMEALDIKKLVVKLGGIIVPSSAFPGVTHIIANSEEDTKEQGWRRAKEEGRIRVMSDAIEHVLNTPGGEGQGQGQGEREKKDMLFVHHVGYPCSHDEFMPASQLGFGEDLSKVKFQGSSMKNSATERKDPWLVTPDWIKQSGLLHEWMFEPDFEAISGENFGDSLVEVVTPADLAQLEERSKILKQQQAEERKKRERERLEKEAELKMKKLKREAEEKAEKAAKAARLQQERLAKHAEKAERAEKEKAEKAAAMRQREQLLLQQQQQQQNQKQNQQVAGIYPNEMAMRSFAETHASLPTTQAGQTAIPNPNPIPTEQQQQQQKQKQQEQQENNNVVGVTISSAGVASLNVKEVIPEHHEPLAPPGVIHPNSNDKMDVGERDERRELFRVPAHSAWFSWDSIHEIEKASMPEFFNNKSASKTPKIYKEYRDFMIDMFREHPQRKLLFTECRKFMVGDVNAIYRVFAFLEHWSLINFDPDQLSKVEVEIQSTKDKNLPGDDKGKEEEEEEEKEKKKKEDSTSNKEELGVALPAELKIVKSQTGYNVDSLVNFKPVSVVKPMLGKTGVWPLGLVTKKGKGGTSPADQVAKEVKFVCNISGKDCTNVRYHCTTIPDYDLSPESFEECKREKKFAPGMSETDFVRIDHTATDRKTDPNHWSKEEILLLLEGLEVFGENWAEVAEHVGTKSQLQCITYFISLPIEDPYLNELEGEKKAPEVEELDPIPFADTGNPVMAQVAFLATMVGPKVAAAAAQKALSVLYETEPHVMANQPSGSGAESNEKTSGGKDADGDETMKDANGKVNNSEVNTSEPPTSASVKAAVATGLAAAAVKAKLLADKEEQEIQKLVIQVIEKQMLKLEMKMKNFEELDVLLQREREEIQKARHQLIQEKLAFQMQKIAAAKGPTPAAPAVPAAPPKAQVAAAIPTTSVPTPATSTPPSATTTNQQPVAAPIGSGAPSTASQQAANPLPTQAPATVANTTITTTTNNNNNNPPPAASTAIAKEPSPHAPTPVSAPASAADVGKAPTEPQVAAAPSAVEPSPAVIKGPVPTGQESAAPNKADGNKMDIDTTPN